MNPTVCFLDTSAWIRLPGYVSNLSKIVVVSNPIIVDNVFDPHVLNDKKTNINDSDSSYTNSPTVVGELADNIVETTPTTVGDIKFIPL